MSPGKKNKRRFLESWVTPKDKDKPEKEKGDNKHSDKNSAPAPSVIKEEKEAPLSAVKIEKEEKEETEKEVEEEKDPLEVIRERTGIVVKTGAGFESRWSTTVLEEENFQPDCASLNLVGENQDNLGKRAVVVSTIFRNLSFVPGNETILSSSAGFLAVCGKMLLHHHWHPPRTSKQRNYDRGEEEDFTESCTSLSDQPEWWWDHLQVEFLIPWCFTKSPFFLGTAYNLYGAIQPSLLLFHTDPNLPGDPRERDGGVGEHRGPHRPDQPARVPGQADPLRAPGVGRLTLCCCSG